MRDLRIDFPHRLRTSGWTVYRWNTDRRRWEYWGRWGWSKSIISRRPATSTNCTIVPYEVTWAEPIAEVPA